MESVKTFVYFDIEATGLKSCGRPRISEISFIAVNSKDIIDLNVKLQASVIKKKEDIDIEEMLPRVINKLTVCVYPMATIVPLVSDITGMDNYNLSGQSKFDKNTGELINCFLSRLPQPVCLVAHNGGMYDFPLFKAELEKSGTILGSDIFCVDSYVGIKEIFWTKNSVSLVNDKKENNVKERHIIKMEVDAVTKLMNDGEFDKEFNEAETHSVLKNENVKIKASQTTPDKTKGPVASINIPTKQKTSTFTPLNKFRKNLEFSVQKTPNSYSLINLHTHFLGFPPRKSHGAEADCLTLLRTTAMLGQEWLEWVDNNYNSFENYKRMWE